MTKYLAGAITGALTLILGGWLIAAPFALGAQGSGDWNGQTSSDVWTGVGVLLIGALTVMAFAAGLRADLYARGLLRAPARPEPEPAPAPVVVTAAPSADTRLEDVLLPLVTALSEDLRRNHDRTPERRETEIGRPTRPDDGRHA